MTQSLPRVPTGITGLDEVLHGGLVAGRNCLVRGGPGSGKTTLGLHFLAAGATLNEKSLFISLEESEDRIRQDALQRGIDLSQVEILDISANSQFFTAMESYDIFTPDEVEREAITQHILETISLTKPVRVFLDPLSQLRYLSTDTFQFRKQVFSFLRFLTEQGCTVLFTSEKSASQADDELQFASDGIIDLNADTLRRTLSVHKLRGSSFHSGQHTVKLSDSGFEVFPLLLPNVQPIDFAFELMSSGIPDLDGILNGGIERGTITIITGPSGVGKTSLGMQFMKEAAGRGERSVIYTFEEDKTMILARCDGINIPARQMIATGTLQIVKVDPLQYTPEEFARLVRDEVNNNDTRIVMIDSIAGFKISLQNGDLKNRLHGLCKYLQNIGVGVIVINEVEAITGDFKITEDGISYLADNVIFMRYIEFGGKLCKAIGVIKKRLSDFDSTVREFEITHNGLRVGKPLSNLSGILWGVPTKSEDNGS